jgi:AcrR family transcriptional regulator
MPETIHPTKLLILKAAVSLFSSKSFNGTTTKEIAQEAGIAEGTIFRHFPNKLEILYGVADSLMPMVGVETLKSAIEESRKMDAEQALKHIMHNRFELLSEARDVLRIILSEMQYDSHLREVYMGKVYKPIIEMVKDFFTERMRDGEFRAVDPNLPTIIMFASIIYIVADQYLLENNEGKFTPDDFADMLLNGIGRRESNEKI